jgi:hypothetical protein
MMEVQFKIKPKGGVAETVTAELVDVIAWEEKYQRPSTELGGDNIFARDFVWLAWHAQNRTGKTSMEFMDWVATLEDIEGTESAPLEPSENPVVTG